MRFAEFGYLWGDCFCYCRRGAGKLREGPLRGFARSVPLGLDCSHNCCPVLTLGSPRFGCVASWEIQQIDMLALRS
jgi:hypothetical protein